MRSRGRFETPTPEMGDQNANKPYDPSSVGRLGVMVTTDAKQDAIDIRAKIMWGDDPEEVRQAYLAQDHGRDFIDPVIREALTERGKWFRQMGVRVLLFGISCSLGCLLFLYLSQTSSSAHRGDAGGVLLVVGFSLGACFFFMRGIRRIRTGGRGMRAG